jgi:DNA-directed RNA polymerase specialized sigma24 family protein
MTTSLPQSFLDRGQQGFRPLLSNIVTDDELLERFLNQRDEAAFELLMWRHGPMVYSVCQRVLGNVQDAEDAFQAAFLLLARKAGSIRRRRSLTGWLSTVAYRVARRAARRARRE